VQELAAILADPAGAVDFEGQAAHAVEFMKYVEAGHSWQLVAPLNAVKNPGAHAEQERVAKSKYVPGLQGLQVSDELITVG
jgi:hypothetical protein